MDSSLLISFGKVAGPIGIALGIMLVLVKYVLDRSGSLSQPMQGRLLIDIAYGAFAIGVLALVFWWLSEHRKGQRAQTAGEDSPARNIAELAAWPRKTHGPRATVRQQLTSAVNDKTPLVAAVVPAR